MGPPPLRAHGCGPRVLDMTTSTTTTAPDSLTDVELAEHLAVADVRLARVRLADPRGDSRAYTDARETVDALVAERRRREEDAAVAAAELIVAEAAAHVCPPSCRGAHSHISLCECACRGEHHGADHRTRYAASEAIYRARQERAGGALALMRQDGMFTAEEEDEDW